MKKPYTILFLIILLAFISDVQSQWVRQANGLPESWSTGWAIDACDNYNAIISLNSTEYPLYKTSDGGNSWTPVDVYLPSGNTVIDIEMISPTNYVAVSGSQILVTTNGGSTWGAKFNNSSLTEFFNYVEMFDENKGIAMGDPVGSAPALFVKTTDGGQTWTSVNANYFNGNPSGDTWRRMDFINSNTGYFFPSIMGASNTKLYKTTTGGATWNYTGLDGYARNLKFYNETIGFVYDFGEIQRTTDAGNTWTKWTTQMTGCGMDFEFTPGNPNKIWFTDGAELYLSENMGETWIVDPTPELNNDDFLFNDIIFTDADHGWLLCTSGYLFHYGEVQTDVDEDYDTPTNFTLNQNYPNPFNPTTVISFQLAESSSTSLRIYNSLGEEIKTLLNNHMSAGLHEIEFNAVDLPSGVYFYKLQAGKFSETKKLLLMK